MKSLLSSLLFTILISSNVYAAAPVAKAAPESTIGSIIAISNTDRACKKDNDCVAIADRCSCSCGTGVAKSQHKKYAVLHSEMCKDYKGKMCKIACTGAIKCKDNLCSYVTK